MAGAQLSVGVPQRLHATLSDAGKAAFFGLRSREQRQVLFRLSVALGGLLALLWGPFVCVVRDVLSSLADAYVRTIVDAAHGRHPNLQGLHLDPHAPIAVVLIAIIAFTHYVALAAYEAGCHRWMIRGETGGVWGLALG